MKRALRAKYLINEIWGFIYICALLSFCFTLSRFSLLSNKVGQWSVIQEFGLHTGFESSNLIILLSKPLLLAGLSAPNTFALWDFISIVSLLIGLYLIFSLFTSVKWAKGMSIYFIFILPLPLLVSKSQFNYSPATIPQMTLIVFAMLFILKMQWAKLHLITMLFALNSHTAVIIPLFFLILAYKKIDLSSIILHVSISLIILVTTFKIASYFHVIPAELNIYGSLIEILTAGGYWKILTNLRYTLKFKNGVTLLALGGFLPVAAVILHQHVPQYLKRLYYLLIIMIFYLFYTANLTNPQQTAIIIPVSYFLAALGVYCYLGNNITQTNSQLIRNSIYQPVRSKPRRVIFILLLSFTISTIVVNFLT